jgi:hypothetical protein
MAKNKKKSAVILSSLHDLRQQVANLQSQLLSTHAATSTLAHRRAARHSEQQPDEIKVFELRDTRSSPTNHETIFDSLLDRARVQFLLRDWNALSAIDPAQISDHKDRAHLGLLSAIGLANTKRFGEAKSHLRQALQWGCSPRLAASLLVSGIHHSMAGAHLALGNMSRAQAHNHAFSASVLPGSTPTLPSSSDGQATLAPQPRSSSVLQQGRGNASTFFIKKSYKHRTSYHHFDDTPLHDEYQDGVYRHARALADKHKHKTVFDIGCGSGFKLLKYFSAFTTVGSEIEPTLTWLHSTYPNNAWLPSDFASEPPFSPDLIICSDVIEHLLNPDLLLTFIARLRFKHLVISTPERDATQMMQRGCLHDGPPENPCHVREWTYAELGMYLSEYFRVVDHLLLQNPAESRAICQVFVCAPQL